MAKFEEKNCKTIEVIRKPLIYFLINNDEVVYVGQTKYGLSRPFSHRDKEFNRLEILECKENELDILENKYIIKYQPKYNTLINKGYKIITARNKLRKVTGIDITVRDVRKIMKDFNIQSVIVGENEYLMNEDIIQISKIIKEQLYGTKKNVQ